MLGRSVFVLALLVAAARAHPEHGAEDGSPLVSVVIADTLKSSPGLLKRALTNVIVEQSYSNVEVLVMDSMDCKMSTDEASFLMDIDLELRKDQVSKLRYFCLDHDVSLAARKNLALSFASADIIAMWSVDVLYGKTRIADQVTSMQAEDVDVVTSHYAYLLDLTRSAPVLFEIEAPQQSFYYGSVLMKKSLFSKGAEFHDVADSDAQFVKNSIELLHGSMTVQAMEWCLLRLSLEDQMIPSSFKLSEVKLWHYPKWITASPLDLTTLKFVSKPRVVINRYPDSGTLNARSESSDADPSVSSDSTQDPLASYSHYQFGPYIWNTASPTPAPTTYFFYQYSFMFPDSGTKSPTVPPTPKPTRFPTSSPTPSPHNRPTPSPTRSPSTTSFPTRSPTRSPSPSPTKSPTPSPTHSPLPFGFTRSPTGTPPATPNPTNFPTAFPTFLPTPQPTGPPSPPSVTPPSMTPTGPTAPTTSSSPTPRPTGMYYIQFAGVQHGDNGHNHYFYNYYLYSNNVKRDAPPQPPAFGQRAVSVAQDATKKRVENFLRNNDQRIQ